MKHNRQGFLKACRIGIAEAVKYRHEWIAETKKAVTDAGFAIWETIDDGTLDVDVGGTMYRVEIPEGNIWKRMPVGENSNSDNIVEFFKEEVF